MKRILVLVDLPRREVAARRLVMRHLYQGPGGERPTIIGQDIFAEGQMYSVHSVRSARDVDEFDWASHEPVDVLVFSSCPDVVGRARAHAELHGANYSTSASIPPAYTRDDADWTAGPDDSAFRHLDLALS